MSATPAFGRGGQAAVETSEEMAPKGGGYRKVYYLPDIGKDKSIFLRYVMDSPEFFYAKTHPMVKTKNKPADYPADRKWPELMSAICRYDDALKGDPDKGIPPVYSDCYVCDSEMKDKWGRVMKPKLRVWAVACLREEVVGAQEHVDAGIITAEQIGTVIGYTDQTREVEVPKRDEKGEVVKDASGNLILEKKTELALVLVNKAVNNYFGGLQSIYGMFKTICNRDFAVIQRNDTGNKDIDFQHVPLDVTPNHKPGADSWQRYQDARKEQGLTDEDIAGMLAERSSDDFYAKFIDPTKAAPAFKSGDQQGGATNATEDHTNAAAPANDPDPDALAALRNRVRGPQGEAPVTVGASAGAVRMPD